MKFKETINKWRLRFLKRKCASYYYAYLSVLDKHDCGHSAQNISIDAYNLAKKVDETWTKIMSLDPKAPQRPKLVGRQNETEYEENRYGKKAPG